MVIVSSLLLKIISESSEFSGVAGEISLSSARLTPWFAALEKFDGFNHSLNPVMCDDPEGHFWKF
ncbi:hypothetical protein H5410_043678 [Solanum commersonii]|uniref:Uncharacterized protein n=1 Tax=Solanum commersonii TaxID=4109 RepID=A0A9J5Y1G2_SOLCO|nr:hypothetical protein H5410_043678 [Solanum commersonii]